MSLDNASEIQRLWAVDLDRTTLDTDKALGAFTNSAINSGLIDESEIMTAQRKVEKSESAGSFDVLQYLRHEGLSEEDLSKIIDDFVSQPNTDHLYADTLPFLNKIDAQADRVAMLLTHGSVDWQTAKLMASGLGGYPYMVTDEKYKGRLIREWQTPDKRYKTGAVGGMIVIANTVSLVDDKARNFNGLPDDCNGYLIRRAGAKILRSQMGRIPSNTKAIKSLSEIPVS